MADGYAYKAKTNGEWVDINLIESPAELTTKLEKDEEWAKVVRCKECKWYEIAQIKRDGTDDERYKPSVCVRDTYAKSRNADWFCADGERREDEVDPN